MFFSVLFSGIFIGQVQHLNQLLAADGTAVASARRFLALSLAISLLFVIFSHWSHLQNLNGQEVCIATLILCALHLLQKRLIALASDIAKWKKETKWAECKLMLVKATERLERLITLSRQLKLTRPI